MVVEDDIKQYNTVPERRYFQQIEVPDNWQMMLSTHPQQKTPLLIWNGHNLMADKLGVLNISNYQKNENWVLSKIPITWRRRRHC